MLRAFIEELKASVIARFENAIAQDRFHSCEQGRGDLQFWYLKLLEA
jgi:hypothetical protein